MAEKEKTLIIERWDMEVEEPKTKCKHGWYECKKCGTNQRSDTLHTTINGRGVVGRLFDKWFK